MVMKGCLDVLTSVFAVQVNSMLNNCRSFYMIVRMIMLMFLFGTVGVVMAACMVMVMAVVIVSVIVLMMVSVMSVPMAMRMSVVRMTAHCYHAEQIDEQSQSTDQKKLIGVHLWGIQQALYGFEYDKN